jgi:type II secretory pathway pseudopilin PulG
MSKHTVKKQGFSLIEALVALSVTAMAGAVLLLSVESSLNTTTEAVDRTIADGIAQQVIDEILTKRYVEAGESGDGTGPNVGPIGPSANEQLGLRRKDFDDTDDYAGYVAHPLKGIWGQPLGTGDDEGNQRSAKFRVPDNFFDNWRMRIEVYYVNPNDHTLSSATPTAYRAIEVHIELIGLDGAVTPLAHRKRVIAYVPPTT